MKLSFSQTVIYNKNNKTSSDYLAELQERILNHTGWEYSYHQKDNGCFLRPTFKKMPFRNSFVPEINIVASFKDAQTILHISGQPIKLVRIFMACWFSFLLLIEVLLLVLMINSQSGPTPLLIPIGIGVIAYALCRIATKASFISVVKCIKDEKV